MRKLLLLLCVPVLLGAQGTHQAAGVIPEFKEESIFSIQYKVTPDLEMNSLADQDSVELNSGVVEQGQKERCTTLMKKPNSYTAVGTFSAYICGPRYTKSTNSFITADGTDLRKENSCVVANNTLKFGTKITIEGIGTCVVKDRMGRGGKHKFDLHMKSLAHAKKFGVKKLRYTIVSADSKPTVYSLNQFKER